VESSVSWTDLDRTEKDKNAYMLVYERVNPLEMRKHRAMSDMLPATTPTGAALSLSSSVISSASAPAAAPSLQEGANPIDNLKTLVEQREKQISSENPMEIIDQVMQARTVKEVVPREIIEWVVQDNAQFMSDRQVFSPDYFAFVKDMLRCVTLPDCPKLVPPEECNQQAHGNLCFGLLS